MEALAARLALLLLTAAAMVSCSKPPPDPHGIPAKALDLQLGSQVREELVCDKKKNDCTDWWRVRVVDPGELKLTVDAAAARGDRPTFTLALADDRAQIIHEVHSYGRVKLEQSWRVEPGHYFVRLHSGKESRGPAMNYWMSAELVRPRTVRRQEFTPPPTPRPPPEPVYRTVRSSLLELEPGPGGDQYILIGSGSDQGVRSGQRGKLMDGGVAVVDFEIVDVYPEGSRARLDGHPSGQITPKLAVEVYVPESRNRHNDSPW